MSFGGGAFKVEAVVVSIQDRGFSGFANNMIKIPVKKAKKRLVCWLGPALLFFKILI